jgi:hypothetical protein
VFPRSISAWSAFLIATTLLIAPGYAASASSAPSASAVVGAASSMPVVPSAASTPRLRVATLGAGGAHSVASVPAANIAPSPSYPGICQSQPSSSSCEDTAVAALNNARAVMGLPAYSLPANFDLLSTANQLLVLSNQDRQSYGLTLISGLNATLNAVAATGISGDTDPVGPTSVEGNPYIAWTSNWAAGWASPLYTYYEWMYDDGPGSSNVDCPYSSSAGCWGHRKDTLTNFGVAQVAMGVGAGTSPRYQAPAFTELYEAFSPSATLSYVPGIVGGLVTLPVGYVESVTPLSPSQVRITGWSYDPANPGAADRVDLYPGSGGLSTTADLPRPDVQAAFGLPSAAHGFSAVVTMSGPTQLSIYAISTVNDWQHSTLYNAVVAMPVLLPMGNIDSVTKISPTQVRVTGWSYDTADPTASNRVDIYSGGVGQSTTTTLSRPDVQAAYGLPSSAHGFSVVLTMSGPTQLSIYAISTVNDWQHTTIYNGVVVMPVLLPTGNVDSVTPISATQVRVTGWSYDTADPTASNRVDIYVGGVGQSTTANLARPDVQAAFGLPSAAHGFSVVLTVPSPSEVTVYGISTVFGWQHTVLSDSVVAIPVLLPVGTVESVTRISPTQVRVTGWAYDQWNPTAASRVDVYVGGVGQSTTANLARPDVQAAFGLPSNAHGFSVVLTASATTTVSVYAISSTVAWQHTTLFDGPVGV